MRFLFAALVCFGLFANLSVEAADFSVLKDGIRKYRALTNTPDVPDIVFTNQQGEEMRLADFKGKTVLLNLWATWCPPCIKEMPDLNELAAEYKDHDFVVVAIATGRQGRETPDEFLKERNLTHIQSYLDPKQELLKLMEITTLPVSFFVSPDSKLQGGVIGITEWTAPEAKLALDKLLLK